MKNEFLVFSGHFLSDLFPKGSKVILWYVLVISRFLLLCRVFVKRFQEDSATFLSFRVKFANNCPKWVKLFFLQLTPNYFLIVSKCKMG